MTGPFDEFARAVHGGGPSGQVGVRPAAPRYEDLRCPRCGWRARADGGIAEAMFGMRGFCVKWSAADEGLRIDCGRCGYTWIIAELAPEPPSAPEPYKRERLFRSKRRLVWLEWAAAIALVLVAVSLGYLIGRP